MDVGNKGGFQDVRSTGGKIVIDVNAQLGEPSERCSGQATVAVDDDVLGLLTDLNFLPGVGAQEGRTACHRDGLDLTFDPERLCRLLDLGEFVTRVERVTREQPELNLGRRPLTLAIHDLLASTDAARRLPLAACLLIHAEPTGDPFLRGRHTGVAGPGMGRDRHRGRHGQGPGPAR
jgi:hypothetical protein